MNIYVTQLKGDRDTDYHQELVYVGHDREAAFREAYIALQKFLKKNPGMLDNLDVSMWSEGLELACMLMKEPPEHLLPDYMQWESQYSLELDTSFEL